MLVIEIVKFLTLVVTCEAMTMKQIRNTGKMMRKSCQPKNNVEDGYKSHHLPNLTQQMLEAASYLEDASKYQRFTWSDCLSDDLNNPAVYNKEKIDPIADGVFIDEKEVKCYMACIMKMANTIKNGKLNFDAALKQADLLLPDEVKEPAKEAIIACKKVADAHKDICDVSFHVTKCIYNQNPGIFYFP